jgi:hypothetical protein
MRNMKKKSDNRYEDYLDILGQIKSEMEIDEGKALGCKDSRNTGKHKWDQNPGLAQRRKKDLSGKESGSENGGFQESKENQRKEANLSKALNTKFQNLFDNYLKSNEKACNPRIDLKKLEGHEKGANLVDDPDQELSERINAQLYKVYEMEARGKMLKFV